MSVLARHVVSFAFLPFALVAAAGAFRREPFAYGTYALLGLVPALSDYALAHPLFSLQRFLAVLFPLQLWLALWASTSTRYRLCVAVSTVGLIGATALFATGHLA